MNRTEAIEFLITTLAAWPEKVEHGKNVVDESCSWALDDHGRPALCVEGCANITREDWSDARRHALGRPEEWPRAAMIQVQTQHGHWFFGTYDDAEPSKHGEWSGIGPGTWLSEGMAQGRADICGWGWECSLTRRDDALNDAPTEEEEEAMRAIEERQASARVEPAGIGADPASHYRRIIRVEIGAEDIERGYVDVLLDPYRIADLYEMRGGPREQIMKKALRGISKGHDERHVAADIRSALDRWDEILDEIHISYR